MAASDNLRGAGFMTLSMAGFAIEDMFVKAASRSLPVGQVLLLTGVIGMMVFAVLSLRRGESLFHSVMLSPAMLVRSSFEAFGRLFYALAVALTPLSLTSAILQATPLVVMAGAALFFGERVGWRRWGAVLVGFIGVMIILRPGFAGFSILSLLGLAGMLGFAGRDLATRAAPKTLSNRQLGLMGFTVLTLTGMVLLGYQGGPQPMTMTSIAYCLGCAFFGITGYHCLTTAMRLGQIGFVTPFRYIRLVFALILAVLVFNEVPDLATLFGSALIVGSGVYALLRERRARPM